MISIPILISSLSLSHPYPYLILPPIPISISIHAPRCQAHGVHIHFLLKEITLQLESQTAAVADGRRDFRRWAAALGVWKKEHLRAASGECEAGCVGRDAKSCTSKARRGQMTPYAAAQEGVAPPAVTHAEILPCPCGRASELRSGCVAMSACEVVHAVHVWDVCRPPPLGYVVSHLRRLTRPPQPQPVTTRPQLVTIPQPHPHHQPHQASTVSLRSPTSPR